MKKAGKKNYTPIRALKKAADYCVLQERCQQEIRSKLYEWGLFGEETEQCIAELISTGFINEERFAKAFAGGKFRIKKWGKIKIRNELKRKNISEYCINKGLREINDSDYTEALKEILLKKSKELKALPAGRQEKNMYKKMNRLASFVLQKGYESERVWNIVREMFIK
ncbi:MAG: regulatory protein RecX [Bacteroidota bacterium]